MLQYTKATLKAHLQAWVEGNGADADEDFVAALDEIIQLGELMLTRDLDLENQDSVGTTSTSADSAEVFRPDSLIVERFLYITVDGRKRQLNKRSRAYVEMFNRDDATGVPEYYCELDQSDPDTGRWLVAPVSDADYMVTVHGTFLPTSITDGNDDAVTWFSTRVPDVLALACQIKAAENLKFWSRKAAAEAEYKSRLDDAKASVANMTRADIEDLIGGRRNMQQPMQAPEPSAT